MTEPRISCNYRNCERVLDDQAYVTSCSHIFCIEHGEHIIKSGAPPQCLVCGTKFDKQGDFKPMHLTPTDQFKSMVLTGYHPDAILEMASRSISFYIYQLSFENNNKENIIKVVRQQNKEIKDYCRGLQAKFKGEVVRLQNKLKSYETEMEVKSKELEVKRHQLVEANRLIKKLQVQNDTYKREIGILKSQRKSLPCTPTSTINRLNGQHLMEPNFVSSYGQTPMRFPMFGTAMSEPKNLFNSLSAPGRRQCNNLF